MQGYPHQTRIQIRYNDLDTLGHVNNAVYFSYIELARVRFFRDTGIWEGAKSQYGVILAKATLDYKVPVLLSDEEVDVWTRCSRLGTKSFDLEQAIVRKDGTLTTTAFSVGVAYDYNTNQSIALPEAWRTLLLKETF